jgi:hypothetical protein
VASSDLWRFRNDDANGDIYTQDASPGWYQRWLIRFDPSEPEFLRLNTTFINFQQDKNSSF